MCAERKITWRPERFPPPTTFKIRDAQILLGRLILKKTDECAHLVSAIDSRDRQRQNEGKDYVTKREYMNLHLQRQEEYN